MYNLNKPLLKSLRKLGIYVLYMRGHLNTCKCINYTYKGPSVWNSWGNLNLLVRSCIYMKFWKNFLEIFLWRIAFVSTTGAWCKDHAKPRFSVFLKHFIDLRGIPTLRHRHLTKLLTPCKDHAICMGCASVSDWAMWPYWDTTLHLQLPYQPRLYAKSMPCLRLNQWWSVSYRTDQSLVTCLNAGHWLNCLTKLRQQASHPSSLYTAHADTSKVW
jgi:hypothetical protein